MKRARLGMSVGIATIVGQEPTRRVESCFWNDDGSKPTFECSYHMAHHPVTTPNTNGLPPSSQFEDLFGIGIGIVFVTSAS